MASGASSSTFEIINWYELILSKAFSSIDPTLSPHAATEKALFWSPLFASIIAVLLIVVIAVSSGFSRMNPEKMSDEELLPPKEFGLTAFLELSWDVVRSTLESTIGENNWKRFVPVLGGAFFVLMIANLSGVVPGFVPATSDMSFTFAAASIIFIYFNFYGLKEAGFDYIKHLAGPILWIAPLLFIIELVSLFSRPISLSLRVFGNISGDHFVFSIFSGLMEKYPFLPIPAIFLAFGTFVSCVQAFIFMTLSAVYIKLALDSKSHH